MIEINRNMRYESVYQMEGNVELIELDSIEIICFKYTIDSIWMDDRWKALWSESIDDDCYMERWEVDRVIEW